VGDILRNGIVMTGGGSLIYGFDKLIEKVTGIKTYVAKDAVSCVAIGTGKALENFEELENTQVSVSKRNQNRRR
jgi:rod shape-determining protein MreB